MIEPRKQQTRDEIMSIVREAIKEWDITTLSNRTRLSKSCLYSIRNGRTLWPRWATLWELFSPLKIELIVRRITE